MKFHIYFDKKLKDDNWVTDNLIKHNCDVTSPKACRFMLKTEAYIQWRKQYEQQRSKR